MHILTDNLVDFLDEVGGWKVCELRGDSFKVINSLIVGTLQFVHLLLHKHFGGIGQMLALLKEFTIKEESPTVYSISQSECLGNQDLV